MILPVIKFNSYYKLLKLILQIQIVIQQSKLYNINPFSDYFINFFLNKFNIHDFMQYTVHGGIPIVLRVLFIRMFICMF